MQSVRGARRAGRAPSRWRPPRSTLSQSEKRRAYKSVACRDKWTPTTTVPSAPEDEATLPCDPAIASAGNAGSCEVLASTAITAPPKSTITLSPGTAVVHTLATAVPATSIHTMLASSNAMVLALGSRPWPSPSQPLIFRLEAERLSHSENCPKQRAEI
eukprot:6479848-Prymnesium_polylepis.2